MTQPRRIALCTTELRPGGAERCLVQLATRLDRRQFAPRVFVLAEEPPAGERQLVESLSAAEVPLEFLGARGFWQAARVARLLTGRLRDERIELVQTFLFHANVLGAWAARRSGVARVVAGIRVAERHSGWHIRVQRLCAGSIDRFVCVSDDVARFSEAAGFPRQKLVVIPNGIDVTAIDSISAGNLEEFGVQPPRRAMCYIGRLDRQKRVDWLLRALASEPEIFSQHDLLLVGQGSERERLEAISRKLKINQHVHFLGWRRDAIAILKACDLLVLGSAWEGMPNVVLEAMTCGRPVVTTDVEGVRQLVGELSDMQVVGRDDPRGFAERARRMLAEIALASRVGAENQRRASEKFSLNAMVERYAALYSELLIR